MKKYKFLIFTEMGNVKRKGKIIFIEKSVILWGGSFEKI